MIFRPRLFSFVLGLLALPGVAGADECRAVRLDDPGQPFARIPHFDQFDGARGGDLNICNSIVATELIDASRFYADPAHFAPSAPVSVAANYKDYDLQARTAIGNIESKARLANIMIASGAVRGAVEANRGKFACKQNALSGFLRDVGSGKIASPRVKIGNAKALASTENFLAAILEQAEVYRAQFSRLETSPGMIAEGDEPEDTLLALGKFFCRNAPASEIPLKNLLRAVVAAGSQLNPLLEVRRFLGAACVDHGHTLEFPATAGLVRATIPAREGQSLEATRKERLLGAMNALLGAERPTPLGITFCRNAMVDLKVRPRTQDQDGQFAYENCAAHGSVVIGQHRNEEGRCEFLVRDSYGDRCERSGAPVAPARCENGSYWIDADQLVSATYELTWIPRGEP